MKKLILTIALLIGVFSVKADHNAGGKVAWKCVKTGTDKGKFVFTVHLYRFCTGIPLWGSATLSSNSPAGTISLTRISQSDISPSCYLGQQIDCAGGPGPEDYAIEEHVYQSAPLILNGVPPSSGWSFQWNSCCRPSPAIYNKGFLVDNLEPQNQSYRIQAIMYPYQNKNTNPCYDSSPTFAETPATIICTNYEFTYNHNAEDEENDSLTFAWTSPLLSNGAQVSYATHLNTSQVTPRPDGGNFIVPSPGFSPTVPMPWSHPNMNVANQPATLNTVTGEITFLSYTPGSYATAVVCDAFKCGVKVASIYIDIPVFLISCVPLPPPFPPGTYNTPPDVSITYKGVTSNNLNISVLAGEYVSFEVQSTDVEFLPGFQLQSNVMRPSSGQFGSNYTDTLSGCDYLPCATMDTSTTGPLGYYKPLNNEWEGEGGLRSNFNWRTDCNHLAKQINTCFVRSNVYTFIFKILDDYCPAPGANFVTASITVNAPDPIPAPTLKCVSIANNGDVTLSWNLPLDPTLDSNNSFRKYVVFRASKRDTADYTPIDTILNPLNLTFTDLGANAHVSPKHYFVMGVSSCNDQSRIVKGDTISTMTLNAQPLAGGDSVQVSWTPFVENNVFPAKTTGFYNVYEVYLGDTTLLASQTSNVYKNEVTSCAGGSKCFPSNVTYFVTVEDTTQTWGCTSYSNSKTIQVGDNKPPVPPTTISASIMPTGGTEINWIPSANCDVEKYYIRENGVLIDSVPGTDISYFRPFIPPTNIGQAPLTYTISTIDSCGNYGAESLPHVTMMDSIDRANIVRCETSRQIPIVLTPYDGTIVTKYILYADTGGGFYPIDSINPASVTFPYTFLYTKFSTNTNFYTFLLRARDTNNVEISNSSVDTLSMYTVDGTVIDPPVLNCIKYLANGDIRIEWSQPTNTSGNFDSYRIYHSTDGNNYTEMDSILSTSRSGNTAWDSTGYTHKNPNPNQDHYYRVYSQSGCFGRSLSVASNSIKPLTLDINKIEANVNELNWDYLITANTTGSNYTIYRNYPVGNGFQSFAGPSKSQTNYNDTLDICEDSARYRIEIQDNGCLSVSNEVTGFFKDNIPPAKQFLDSVSVLNDTNSTLGWSDNPANDITQYLVIQKGSSGGYNILDTISGNARFYNTFGKKGCFAVVPVDSCGNDRLSESDFDYHCTMQSKLNIDRCDESFTIEWNAYQAFKTGPNVLYEVFVSQNGTNYESAGSTDRTYFKYSDIESGNNYCFFVRATESGGNGKFTSTSDSVCATAKFLVKPEYAYMQHVTVRDSGEIELSVWVDLKGDIEEYQILRALDTNNFKQIGTVVSPIIQTPADREFKYIDKTVLTDIKTYYYKVSVIDPCGEEAIRSNEGKSILLNVEADNQAKSNKLSWTSYEGWESGVLDYKVYRKTEEADFRFVETVRDNSNSFTDNVSNLVEESQGVFCYYVLANEATPYFPGLEEPETSRSNEVCVIQYPLFFIPTSFTPGTGNSPGLNDVFKPVGVFIDYNSYSFEVYNRWGEKLFETKDFKKGWDGTFDGKTLQADAYVYIIKYKGADGKEFEQKGTVNLIK